MLFRERAAVSRNVMIISVIAVIAVAAGGIYLSGSGSSGSGGNTVIVSIVESDPVRQADSFSPTNVTAQHGTFTLAVQNNDDQPRVFQISSLNVNQTIGSGSTERISIAVSQAGVYQMYVPATTASSAANGHASPSITGYLIVS
jgi:hypothetical protein